MRMRTIVSFAWELVAELLAPSRCAACDGELPRMLSIFCAACASSIERAPAGTRGVFAYGGAIATAIVRMKYAGRSDLAPRLASTMIASAQRHVVDVVVSVPVHPRRLVERGYDQASLLAAPIAHALRAPRLPCALSRLRDTPRQAALERADRLRNVRGSFACRSPRRVEGRRVLLVDDVYTTGATIDACTEALLAVNARTVVPLVLATREDAARD